MNFFIDSSHDLVSEYFSYARRANIEYCCLNFAIVAIDKPSNINLIFKLHSNIAYFAFSHSSKVITAAIITRIIKKLLSISVTSTRLGLRTE